jgi:hypothetical protein
MSARARGTTLVAFAVGLVVAGCSVPLSDDVELLDRSQYVAEIRPTSERPSAQSMQTPALDGVLLYFVRDSGLRTRVVLAPENFSISDVVAALAAGPEPADVVGGLRSAVSERDNLVADVEIADGIAYVELDPAFGELPGNEQILFLGQVTLSVVSNNLASAVSYTRNGETLAVPDANGQPVSTPTQRQDYIILITR